MRVLGKLGLAFFVVALAVIYAQTFPSMTSQSEILVRLLLWLWVAINTAILVTLLVNACFQQAFPGNQFKARLAEMLQEVASRLADPDAEAPPTFGETAAQFNQLQSLFAQASRATPEIAADPQAWRSRLAATLRCYQLAALLQADEADSDDRLRLSQAVLQLKSALSEGPFDGAIPPLALSGRGVNRAVLQEMVALLQRLALGEPVALPQGEVEKPPLLAPAAWRSVVSIHRGSSGRKTTIRFTAASSRRETPSTGSTTGRFPALCISWLNPRAASEQGERMYSVIIDRQR